MLQRQIGQLASRSSLRATASAVNTPAQLVFVRFAAGSTDKSAFRKRAASRTGSKTPKKGKNTSIHPFAHTAAYSNFQKNAVELSEELPGTGLFEGQNRASLEDAPRVLRYSNETAKSLTHFGSFKLVQKNELFKDHATLVRPDSTPALFDFIKKGVSGSSKTNRVCITGTGGVGKSTALAQAHAIALENGYIVVPVPRPYDLVSGYFDTAAKTVNGTEIHQQPMYAKVLMARIAKGNRALLETIKTTKDYAFDIVNSTKKLTFAKGEIDLFSLLSYRSHSARSEILDAVIEELAIQTQHPVLFTLDDLNVFTNFQHAKNRDVNNNPIYHGQLQVPRTFLQFLSGEREFKSGAVLTALGPYRTTETISYGLGLQPHVDPYSKPDVFDPVLAGHLRANGGVKPFEISHYSMPETETMLGYYSNAKVFAEPLSEPLVQEKYFLSGNGNPKALLKTLTDTYA